LRICPTAGFHACFISGFTFHASGFLFHDPLRHHHQENLQFCRQARDSLTETLDHLNVALDENYLSSTSYNSLRKEWESALKLLNDYIKYLATCAKGSK
jgi:hypothetical protein